MKRITHSAFPMVALTHPGMKGKKNEDSFGVSAFHLPSRASPPVLLAVLCDGIGGHLAGEVAAQLAVETVSREVGRSDALNPPEILSAALEMAGKAIFQRAQASPQHTGMGSTCVCAWIIGDRLFAASVGDSRLYMLRAGRIRRLTTDHTWIQEALDNGMLKPEQVDGHPNQHVIRRYLGSPTPPEVDLRLRLNDDENDRQAQANQGLRLFPGDILLLTSDGLTDLVADDEIEAQFQAAFRPEPDRQGDTRAKLDQAGRGLIELANARGGHDNITLIAVNVPHSPPARLARLQRRIGNGRSGVQAFWPWVLGGFAGLVLAAVLAWGWAGGWFSRDTGAPTVTAGAVPSSSTPAASSTPFATLTPRPSPRQETPTPTTARAELFPLEGGATLTPWPTNTTAP